MENFLTAKECDYFVKIAKEEGMQNSQTTQNSVRSKGITLMDVNRDKRLDIDEVTCCIYPIVPYKLC